MAKRLVKKLVDRILKRKARIKIIDKDGNKWHPRRKEWTDWSTHTFHQKEYDEELQKTKEEFQKDSEDEIERFTREAAEYRWDIAKKPTPGLQLIIDYQDSVIEEVYVEEEVEEEEAPPVIPVVPADVKRRLEYLEMLKLAAETTKGPQWEEEVKAYERAIARIKELYGIKE